MKIRPAHFYYEFYTRVMDLNKCYYQIRGKPDGTPIMNQDWDTLIILDACRYDIFSEINWLDGELHKVTSCGSESREFLKRQFLGNEFHNTVYLTLNPHVSILDSNTFHHIIPLHEEKDVALAEVSPESMTERAIQAHEEFPKKRIIVHYMQPHHPFLGPNGELVEYRSWRDYFFPVFGTDRSAIVKAYTENVEIAIGEVETLLEEISGRVVVTADHGELLKDRVRPIPIRASEHEQNLYVPELVSVPWFVIRSTDRREIVPEPPRSEYEPTAVATDQLEALGYYE